MIRVNLTSPLLATADVLPPAIFLDQYGRVSSDGQSWYSTRVPFWNEGGNTLDGADYWLATDGSNFVKMGYYPDTHGRRSYGGRMFTSWQNPAPGVPYSLGDKFFLAHVSESTPSPVTGFISIPRLVGHSALFGVGAADPDRSMDEWLMWGINVNSIAAGVGADAPVIFVGGSYSSGFTTYSGGVGGWASGPYDGATVTQFAALASSEDELHDVAHSSGDFMAVGVASAGGYSAPLALFGTDPGGGLTFSENSPTAPAGYDVPDDADCTCYAVAGDGDGHFVAVGYGTKRTETPDPIGVIWYWNGSAWSIATTIAGIINDVAKTGVAWSASLGRWVIVFSGGESYSSATGSSGWSAMTGGPSVGVPERSDRPLRARM